ncbi:MAG: hypothetical protein TH68_04490 [Candidatus Synechococcus spongiarum 142]|uniref:Transposase DDE domain-containing protein n=1 Tax=Candidatus Synechococcus spongiarum 142 TaxID=1608213 RepID=A0A6N3X0V6_9SYNE|nr:MAG: hypothetical protein TH68_04490 [Candidatus Synechococcus spongiarum 142]
MLNKVLLHKRFSIDTLFDMLKSSMGMEYTRHQFPTNVFVHLSCLAAYILAQLKAKIGTVAIPDPMPSIPTTS